MTRLVILAPWISITELPGNLAKGVYEIRIALVDENGNARIKLAIEAADSKAGRSPDSSTPGSSPQDRPPCYERDSRSKRSFIRE